MYRPVHATRRDHAKSLLKRAGYAAGGAPMITGAGDGIEPAGMAQEPPLPEIAPKPLPPPISTTRRLGRRARQKIR